MSRKRLRKPIVTSLSFLTLAIVWQCCAWGIDNPQIFPGLYTLFAGALGLLLTPHFFSIVMQTILRALLGGVIACILSIGLSVVMWQSVTLRNYFRPMLSVFRSVPVISFILLFLIWFGPEQIPWIMAIITMTPVLTENLTEGLMHLNRNWLEMAKVYRINRPNIFSNIVYPTVKPYFFSGLISASGLGWKAIVIGEALAQPQYGIGSAIKEAQNFIEIPTLIAWTMIAVLFAFLWETFLRRLQQKDPTFRCAGTGDKLPSLRQNIELKHISFSHSQKEIFADFSYTFPLGKIGCIIGYSGRGKTALLHLLSKLYLPQSGEILPAESYGISMLFQETRLLPHKTVFENVMLPLCRYYSEEEAERRAHEALRSMMVDFFAHRYPATMSGGEKQRVALARAIAFPASVWLFDEPFTGLDTIMKKEVMRTLFDCSRNQNITFIFVSHHSEDSNDADYVLPL